MQRASAEATERLADFAAALRPRLAGDLRLDRLHRALYSTDASLYRVEPFGVLIPRTPDDVQAAMEAAADFGLPVLPRGSGTSLAGSAVGAGLVIDMSRHLDRILGVDPQSRTATVEPGVVLDDLNRAASAHGLAFGPDPASSNRATLGGMVGTNATGARSIRYGSVVDHVVSARVLLAGGLPASFEAVDASDWEARTGAVGPVGEMYRRVDALLRLHGPAIRSDTPRHWRRAGGYRLERLLDAPGVDRGPGPRWDGTRNLAHLLCGSEGTLGIVTEMTLALVPRPAHAALGVAHFESRRAALEAVPEILETGPAAVELFDRIALRRARDVLEYAPRLHFVQGDPAALLIVAYEGESRPETLDGLVRLRRVLGPAGVLTEAREVAQMADVWTIRGVGLGLAMSARLPTQAVPLIEDAAVPVEALPEYVERLEAMLGEHGAEAVVYAHASAGCLHVRPFLDLRTAAGVAAIGPIAKAAAALVREYGGTLASEHGDGLARSALAEEFYGRGLYAAYVATKRAFDPRGLLNPGKIVEAPAPDTSLRAPSSAVGVEVIPFSTSDGRDLGSAGAVDACNGQGVCLKRSTGTMCPSFMATREEKDSTRGRANALREAFTGTLALHGSEVIEAMDLCLSCKACRAECPSSVDMAALKANWLQGRWRARRPALRTRLFAHLPTFARRGAGPAAGLLNAAAGRRARTALGLDPERPLPALTRQPFRDGAGPAPSAAGAVLFVDTFSRFFEPEVPRAALRVLRAGGVAVGVAPYACCGRTLISEGFLDVARRRARAVVDALAPHAAAGRAIVGLEPSCLLTLRDELPRLLPLDGRARAIAAAARTFEEFVCEDGLGGATWTRAPQEALVHAHCHQRALSRVAAGADALALAGITARESGAGCCGLAGGWGYEAGHARVSRAIAEDRLAPAVRALNPDAVIVAAGFSCRHQISHVTGRGALHPAVALASRL